MTVENQWTQMAECFVELLENSKKVLHAWRNQPTLVDHYTPSYHDLEQTINKAEKVLKA